MAINYPEINTNIIKEIKANIVSYHCLQWEAFLMSKRLLLQDKLSEFVKFKMLTMIVRNNKPKIYQQETLRACLSNNAFVSVTLNSQLLFQVTINES